MTSLFRWVQEYMTSSTSALLLAAGAVMVGFAVGFGVGRDTRRAMESHVDTSFEDGKLTLVADVSGALGQGLSDYVGGVFG